MTDAATGPPPSMAGAELTPMLSQYLELCEAHPDALVLFQVGDFYEAFCEAAEVVARVCEVSLTQREDSTGTYPMAGVPIDNPTSYVERLLSAGYRVAVADQVEDADEASGLVDRAVTRVVTPGTLTDDDLLSPGTANYLAALVVGEGTDGADGTEGTDDADGTEGTDGTDATDEAGPPGTPATAGGAAALAVVDVSTGDCRVTGGSLDRMRSELERLDPAELLVGPGADPGLASLSVDPLVTDHDPEAFAPGAARATLSAYAPNPDAVVGGEAELRAVGAVLDYAEYTQGDDGALDYVSRVTRYDPREYLLLDATAIRSLELFESRGPRSGGTLLGTVDRTSSALGRRRLREYLRRPLVDAGRVEARHGAVADLVDRSLVREAVRASLKDVYDVERLVSRVSRGRANARDVRSLKETLDVVPEVRGALADCAAPLLDSLRERLDELADVREAIDEAVAPDPPQELTEGGVIREGYDDELDALRGTEREGREWVAELERRERERTGIDSLEVGHNQVHGYYIEVTDPNLDRVPENYRRRQTLKNAERFYTPELKRREDEILGAAERADKLEYDLFREVRADVADEADRIQAVADALADLDALATLAAVAVENDYVRPSVGCDEVAITAGRHPVVERAQDEFVPNDVHLDPGSVAVITGPNMSGKSTYMRQVALTCVLAQAGSFVPADAARLPVLDRVFTRVGASDDIAGGQSTFMREMAELTDILHAATDDSLVLLDEVGRGTSTADGLAIARAAAEFLHDEVGAYTLFATHYHDLTTLAADRERAFNLHFAADRDPESGEVAFLHRVVDGAASSSYGVEVARMAGVPEAVVERSRALLDDDPDGTTSGGARPGRTDGVDGTHAADGTPGGETAGATETDGGGGVGDGAASRAAGDAQTPAPDADAGVDREDAAALLAALREVDVARTTPLEAMNRLAEFRRRAEDL
jgi:DNA mismatch repair protein MutS